MDFLLPLLLGLVVGAVLGVIIGLLLSRRGGAAAELAALREQATAAEVRVAQAESRASALDEQLALARHRDLEREERDKQESRVLQALAPVQESLRTMQSKVSRASVERLTKMVVFKGVTILVSLAGVDWNTSVPAHDAPKLPSF